MSQGTTAASSVTDSLTAESAANAIEAMLSGDSGEQQDDEALNVEEDTEEVEASDDSDDSDTEDASEEEEESDEEEEAPAPKTFTVKVDGKTVEVTLDELQAGYSRSADYTQKTQQLAQERKAAQAEYEAVRQERAQYSQLLTALEAQLKQADTPVDMDRLYAEDPIEWVRQRELQREKNEKLLAIQAEQQRLTQAQQQEMQQQQQAYLSQQKELLLAAVPELKDPEKARDARKSWTEAGKAIGLTEAEINSITDHRLLLALKKLASYDSLVAKRQTVKPQPVQKVAPAKPGQATEGKAKVNSTVMKQAQQRLKKSGSVKDAASLLSQII